MSYQHQIVAMNNIGAASAVSHEELPTSLALFREALACTLAEIVLQLAVASTRSRENDQHRSARGGRSHFVAPPSLSPLQDPNFAVASNDLPRCDWRPVSSSDERGAPSNDSTFFVAQTPLDVENAFVRPLLLMPPSSSHAYSDDEFIQLTITSTVIIFNLAVTYHRLALSSGGRGNTLFPPTQAQARATRLSRALELYETVQSSLSSIGISFYRVSGNALIDLMMMAVHNNRAQIYFSFCQYGLSQHHLEWLVTLCAMLRQDMYEQDTDSVMDQHSLFFLHNIMALSPPTIAAAA